MEEKITFGKFIVRKRREKALTQRELAEQLYVTESAVSKWERGVSYPDITLVVPLCRALDVTEHELIAGAEDVQQRAADRQAQQYRALVRAWSWTFYILYAVSLAVCFAVNLIVEHRLSWFFLVLGGEALAFSLTSLPLIVPKNKGMWTLAGFFASLCLLLAICCIYVGGDWLAVTLTAVSFGFCVVFAPLILRELSLPAPLGRHRTLICFVIDREIKKGADGQIVMKINSLTDIDIIMKLQEASSAGVRVKLLIRGICCLLPGISGVTENIMVISVVGRFLEHSRFI